MNAHRLHVSGLRLHPALRSVPAMTAAEFAALKADIQQRGIQVPIAVTAKRLVLDGRHRLQAARELGQTTIPALTVDGGEDETSYVLRAALLRRHLSPSQAAALAIELEQHQVRLAQGRRRQRANLRNQQLEVAMLPPRADKTRTVIAQSIGVSERVVQDALTVQHHNADLFAQIKAGAIPAHRAAREVRRQQRHKTIGAAPSLPDGVFDLILADPPWQLGNPDADYAPEQYYPTLPLDHIKQLPVPAADNAVLFLWAVNGLLPEAIEVMAAWGFAYRSNLVWDKQSIGLGVWTRSQHELLLIGRRGNHPPPAARRRIASVISAKRGRHSEKPTRVYELVEQMYPTARKLELFARGRPRTGWTAWGNEVEQAA